MYKISAGENAIFSLNMGQNIVFFCDASGPVCEKPN